MCRYELGLSSIASLSTKVHQKRLPSRLFGDIRRFNKSMQVQSCRHFKVLRVALKELERYLSLTNTYSQQLTTHTLKTNDIAYRPQPPPNHGRRRPLRSPSSNISGTIMHLHAANRLYLYFTWMPLNYFFSRWFSVGGPPTLLAFLTMTYQPRSTAL